MQDARFYVQLDEGELGVFYAGLTQPPAPYPTQKAFSDFGLLDVA